MTTSRTSARPPPVDRLLAKFKGADKLERTTRISLPAELLSLLCDEAITVLRQDPIVLNILAPVNVIGDIHGQFYDLLTYFQRGGSLPQTSYLFLGDYVDRGYNSIETISYLLALKIKHPKSVWMLRGNHETPEVSKLYGFQEECEARYHGAGLFEKFTEVFRWLPMAAIISDRIFCVHGGLSRDLATLDLLRKIQRPLDIPDEGMLADLLWADPDKDVKGYDESVRGTSYVFGADVVREFLDANDFDLICRGHQCVMGGFDFPFPQDQSVLTVFSAPNYCDELGNNGAMLKVDQLLRCSFEIIPPPGVKPNHDRPATGISRKDYT
jgi:serine/threonine-protein phosphatase PP1 catalytic subunit